MHQQVSINMYINYHKSNRSSKNDNDIMTKRATPTITELEFAFLKSIENTKTATDQFSSKSQIPI